MEESEQYQLEKKKSRYWKLMIGFGIAAFVAPIIGLLGTVAGMIRAFDRMGIQGGADPEKLAGDIHLALNTTIGAWVITPLSLILFIVFLILFLNKKKQLEPQAPPLPTEREQ